MNRGLYTVCLRALAPALWLWMAARARKAGGDWGILAPERFGRHALPPGLRSPVWVHAVSLGETRAAQPLVQALLDRGLPVLLTHTTATGRQEGARRFAAAIARGQLRQAWLPYDFPQAARRFLAHFRPRCGVLIEREVWPNLLAEARAAGVPMVLASARFSESSLRQARWLGRALREAYAGLHAVLAQADDDARRLALAGAPPARVVGNLKFDMAIPAGAMQAGMRWRAQAGRPVVAIASTREGEDEMFVQALAAVPAAEPLLFWLIPRHPQRFDSAAAVLEAAGVPYVRRSQGATQEPPAPPVRVALGDTLGEMPFYYASADVAIVAGSFAPLGGQNLIEACATGTPVIVGPHTHHFADAVRDAVAAGAALQVADAAAALRAARDLLGDAHRRAAMAQAAQRWTARHRGATRRIMEALPLA